jgi:hypothetical protein
MIALNINSIFMFLIFIADFALKCG